MSSKFEAALVKELCFICGKEVDGPIVMNMELTEGKAKEVKDMHGKVVGFTEEPCDECKENMEAAFLFIGYDEDKSDIENLPYGFYRTGHIVGIKKDSPLVQEWVRENVPNAIDKGFLFTPHIIMEKFGLIKL